jgi:hypothetical protein
MARRKCEQPSDDAKGQDEIYLDPVLADIREAERKALDAIVVEPRPDSSIDPKLKD